ncbi:MAG: acetate/propionate family kinase [Chitinophagaceae bacterium]
MSNKVILVVNCGSSSVKFKVYTKTLELIAQAQITGLDVIPTFVGKDAKGNTLDKFDWTEKKTHKNALEYIFEWLPKKFEGIQIGVVGHRVVHGAYYYHEPTFITDEVIEKLEEIMPISPLHGPFNIMPIKEIRSQYIDIPQVAVFDTGFHNTMDERHKRFPFPTWLHEEGVRRYGMHGISYEYVSGKLQEIAPDIAHKKVVICHIGSGCSLAGIEHGKVRITSMGFTVLDGIPMATRPGCVDAGVVLYLLQFKKYTLEQVQKLLFNQSGVKALSNELSSDFYQLTISDKPEAKFALEYMYDYTAQYILKFGVALGGIDAIVFTAGVGENSRPFRTHVIQHLSWINQVQINEERNNKNDLVISTDDSKIKVLVVPTNEELMIAKHSATYL